MTSDDLIADASKMPICYIRGEDMVVGFVGPFSSLAAAEEHILFCAERGDADPGKVITEQEFLLEENPFCMTPEADRNFQFPDNPTLGKFGDN